MVIVEIANLNVMGFSQLRIIAENRKLKEFEKLSKEELIKAIKKDIRNPSCDWLAQERKDILKKHGSVEFRELQ